MDVVQFLLCAVKEQRHPRTRGLLYIRIRSC